MDFSIVSEIPFQPWYYLVITYVCLLSLLLALVSLYQFWSKSAEKDPALHQFKYGKVVGLTWLACATGAVFVIGYCALLVRRTWGIPGYGQWERTRNDFGGLFFSLTFVGLCTALGFLWHLRRRRGPLEKGALVKRGKVTIAVFTFMVVVPPDLAVLLLGLHVEAIQIFFLGCVGVAAGLFFAGAWPKWPVLGSFLHWCSLGIVLMPVIFVISQNMVAHVLLPPAQSYLKNIATRLEQQKTRMGRYPETLPYRSVHGRSVPYLIRRTAGFQYLPDKAGESYQMYIFRDPQTHFCYSSKTRKWSVWRSNLQ